MKDEIEIAERNLLILSWVATLSAFALIVYTVLTFP